MPLIDDTYLAVYGHCRATIKVRGSRFVADAFGVDNVDEASLLVSETSRRSFDASHHCFAYRVGADGTEFRSNDDGEPSGTAGQPILRQIEARSLTNTLVIVTRYFGGTKLGKGGLARAYSDVAGAALQACRVVERHLYYRYMLRFDYPETAAAMRAIENGEGHVVSSEYAEATSLVVDIRRSRTGEFERSFADFLGGRGSLTRIGEASG